LLQKPSIDEGRRKLSRGNAVHAGQHRAENDVGSSDQQGEIETMMLEDMMMLLFGISLTVFVLTRLNSGLSRADRRRLTSAD
jgi:hypothetical protein